MFGAAVEECQRQFKRGARRARRASFIKELCDLRERRVETLSAFSVWYACSAQQSRSAQRQFKRRARRARGAFFIKELCDLRDLRVENCLRGLRRGCPG